LTAETLSDDVNIKLVPMAVVHMKGGGTPGSAGFLKYDLQQLLKALGTRKMYHQ